jgi:membrane protein required for colicin V production
MHALDLVIVAIVAWFTFSAFAAGLIRELVTVIAVIAGVVLAGQFYEELAADITFVADDESTRNFIAFIAIFAGAVVLGQMAAWLLRQAVSLLLLGPFDHLGGAAFGFAKGLILVEVLLLAVRTFPIAGELDAALEQSALAPVFLDGIPVLERVLPDEFGEALDSLERIGGSEASFVPSR